VQEITLSVDAGSKHIGLSAVTAKQELFAADVELRNDSTSLLSTRRNRKTRYRKSRFLNRVSSKKKGWLALSINQRVWCHLNMVAKLFSFHHAVGMVNFLYMFFRSIIPIRSKNRRLSPAVRD